MKPILAAIFFFVCSTTSLFAVDAPTPRLPDFRTLVHENPTAAVTAIEVGTLPDSDNLKPWLAANRESLAATVPGPLVATPWGAATRGTGPHASTLYLHVFDPHGSGKVIAYGLPAASVGRAYWMGDPKKDLKIDMTSRDTLIELTAKNGKAPDAIDSVVVVELTAEPKLNSLTIAPQTDGSVLLHSRESIVVGKSLRYEPEEIKNTCGYWTNPADWVYWEFKLDKPGTFDVELLQGCGKGSGGSEVEVIVADQKLPMVVEDTGHFQNFIPRVVGKVKLQAGTHTLAVKPVKKKGAAVMDLRQVTLKPVNP